MILKVYKPIDWTSNDVVQFIKHFFHFKKVGHAGTLDPKATGLLILATNEDTKQLNDLIKHDKSYEVRIAFHKHSASYDLDSNEVINFNDEINLKKEDIICALNHFINIEYWQEPPMFSAIKINGKKAYDLARNNIEIKLNKKLVHVYDLSNVNFEENKQELSFDISVSSGFYIRSLVRDIANYLNTHAVLINLKRTKIDKYDLNNSLDVLDLKQLHNLTLEQKSDILLKASIS